jgi:hypothetical protein
MKGERGGWRPLKREQLTQELVHDSYKSKKKLPEPTRCPDCGGYAAALDLGRRRGRHETLPGLPPIHDRFPACDVWVSSLARIATIPHSCATARPPEKAEHRSSDQAIEDAAGDVLVTTTDTHRAEHRGGGAVGLQGRTRLPLQPGGKSPARDMVAVRRRALDGGPGT